MISTKGWFVRYVKWLPSKVSDTIASIVLPLIYAKNVTKKKLMGITECNGKLPQVNYNDRRIVLSCIRLNIRGSTGSNILFSFFSIQILRKIDKKQSVKLMRSSTNFLIWALSLLKYKKQLFPPNRYKWKLFWNISL